jgi:lipopolysaccharide biosynthesis glycosyltransferase
MNIYINIMENINICLISDENDIVPLQASINSIIYNLLNKHFKVNIYIICSDIKLFKAKIKNINKDVNLIFLEPTKSILKKTQEITKKSLNYSQGRKYLASIWNFIRFFIQDILPLSVEKCMYLDCDTIVDKDFSEYYFDNKFNDLYDIGVVYKPNIKLNSWIKHNDLIEKFKHIHNSNTLFNAGVSLLNLKNIRKKDIINRVFDLLDNYGKYLLGGTQSIQNLIYDNYYHMPIGLNYTPLNNYNDIIYIYHYSGDIKPWINRKTPEEETKLCYDKWYKYYYLTNNFVELNKNNNNNKNKNYKNYKKIIYY